MSVKLEVGKWYYQSGRMEYLQCVDMDRNLAVCSFRENKKWIPAVLDLYSGPYHIEPGDRVKPKPKGDKCYRMYEKIAGDISDYWSKIGEHTVESVGTRNSATFVNLIGHAGIESSCLILIEKAAKAPAQDFQVGDEVEVLDLAKTVGYRYEMGIQKIQHIGDCGFRVGPDGTASWLNSSHVKLIRRAGVTGGAKLSAAGADTPGDMSHAGASSGISAPAPVTSALDRAASERKKAEADAIKLGGVMCTLDYSRTQPYERKPDPLPVKYVCPLCSNTGMLPGDGFIALKCPECGVR